MKLRNWKSAGIVSDPFVISGVGDMSPFYQPEYSNKRRQIEVKVVDGTHIRNNIRAALCKDQIDGIQKLAWTNIAENKDSSLSLSLLDVQADGKVLDQQKEAYTRPFFSEEIYNYMLEFKDTHGHQMFEAEAKFCKLMQNWIRAENEPGLSAEQRIRFALELKSWLLADVSFGIFPPSSQYIKGFPRVTFEAMVCSMDAHIYLYELTLSRTYNWRAISSLVAETFMSDIQYMDNWARNGVLTALGAKMHMKTACALHAIQHDPDRTFHMRIAVAPVYQARTADQWDTNQTLQPPRGELMTIATPRNHSFDIESCKNYQKVYKKTTISKPDEPARGVQPVRYHYKVDESKILHSKRLGINLQDTG